ncbi:MAG: hypothetical protein IJU40_01470 [Desulfovibrionaceae bacterium]|nr:hypothetical protein [Desulfovibrionaceae bacterium]
MINARRYRAEVEALKLSLPSNMFKFFDMDTDKPYMKMVAITNSKKMYTLRVDLDEFPEQVPKVFITQMLKSKRGHNLNSASAAMHTLPSEHGFTRICHYGFNSWTPNVALNKIYLKCRVWLEAYEAHLKSGEPISHYLGEQD